MAIKAQRWFSWDRDYVHQGEAPSKSSLVWPAPHHVPPAVLTVLRLSCIHTASFIFPFNIGKIHNLINTDSTIPNIRFYIPEHYCYWQSPSPVAAIKPVIYSANTIQTQLVYSVTADISCSLFNPPQGPWQGRGGIFTPGGRSYCLSQLPQPLPLGCKTRGNFSSIPFGFFSV